MSKELVISANRHETKVAILEDDQLVEIYFQRGTEYSLAGSIHKGRVTRVLPGMQSAFVDLGLERDTFLYVSDFFEENEEYDRIPTGPAVREDRPERGPSEPRIVAPEQREPREREHGGRDQRDQGGRDQRDRRDRRPRGDSAEVKNEPKPERVLIPEALPDAEPIELEAVPGSELAEEVLEASIGAPANTADLTVATAPIDPEERERRARRGRRRRNRGRGFPDSKYASEVSADEPAQAGEVEPLAEVAAAPIEVHSDFDFPVLPGESLAKYRSAGASAPTPAPAPRPVVEPQAVEPPVVTAIAEPVVEPELVPMELAPVEPVPVEPAPIEPAPVDTTPAQAVPAEPLPDVHPALSGHIHRIVRLEVEDENPHAHLLAGFGGGAAPALEPVVAHHEPVVHVHVDQLQESEPEHDLLSQDLALHHDALHHDDDHHHDSLVTHEEITELVEEADAEAELAAMEEEEESAESEESEIGAAQEIALDENGEPIATVAGENQPQHREPGTRFSHRQPRRMRRKGRGGPPAGEPAGVPRPEGSRAEGARTETPRAESAPRPEGPRDRDRDRDRDRGERTARPDRAPTQSITELLKEGQEIIVQIAKEPLGQKGARITSHIALPGRYVVYMPTLDHMGVSRKIASDEERLRLKKILQTHRVGIAGGFIVRTAGEGNSEEDIAADMQFLGNLWLDIRQKAERKPAPLLLHHDLDIVQRILRDQVSDSFKSIWVDNEEAYESILRFVQRFQPQMVSRVKMYTRSAPIFDAFSITGELEKALRPKVWLKSGGYIVINQTEALVAIDVNTGKFVGKSNRLEDTIVKINTEAVKEIVRQIRLRDLGGIIVVDFIDMDERKNRAKVMQTLEDAMRVDKAPYKILQFNDFGLVAITRKRVKQSLERALCSPCPYCEGAGSVKSVQTTVSDILIEAHKMARAVDGPDVMLRVHPEVAKFLKSNQNKYLEEMEEVLRRPVLVKSDPLLHQEKFDLA